MLNANELKVLVGLCDEFITESGMDDLFPKSGWAGTSFDSACEKTGFSKNSVKGYLSQLVQKGYVELDTVKARYGDEEYITLTDKCNEVVEYKGSYTWGLKNEVTQNEVVQSEVTQNQDLFVGSLIPYQNSLVKIYKINETSYSVVDLTSKKKFRLNKKGLV